MIIATIFLNVKLARSIELIFKLTISQDGVKNWPSNRLHCEKKFAVRNTMGNGTRELAYL